MRALKAIAALCLAAALFLALAAPAGAASADPLFTYTPEPKPPPEPLLPPPAGQLEGPCGLAVDSDASLYLSDHYHAAIDRFLPAAPPTWLAYADQIANATTPGRPCALAIDSAGRLYAAAYHGAVSRYASFPSGARSTIDPGPATGVAVDPVTDEVYVDDGDHVSVYESSGAPVEVAGQPLTIGQGSLQEGYGIAVSAYPATAGFLYVPDAGPEVIRIFDPATDTEEQVGLINGHQVPGGRFGSLTDAAIAIDDTTGEVYVADGLQPGTAAFPEAAIYVFGSTGAYEGRLKYNIIDARPPGLAVDNTPPVEVEGELFPSPTQGRVYLTSGNTERASVIAYAPGSAGSQALPAPEPSEALPPGGCACGVLPEPPPPLTCEGDSCQHLPSEPTDPTLNTLIEGAANPPVRFHDTNRLAHYRRLRHHHHTKGGRPHKHGRHR
jgi:hypothetical protein